MPAEAPVAERRRRRPPRPVAPAPIARATRAAPQIPAAGNRPPAVGLSPEPTPVQQEETGFGALLESRLWDMLESYAPVLVPIMRKGFFNWLTEKISAAIEALFDRLMKPVRTVTGIFESLSAHFSNLVQWIKEAAGQIARGDCSAIAEAAQKIQDVFMGLATPVVEKIQGWAASVKGFFVDIWDKVGAPVWDFLKSVGGAIWDTIKDIASWIWDKTKPIRDWLARGWKWIKNKLGIGEGPEGRNGVLQWVQEKAAIAWTWVKDKLAPYRTQILIVAGVIVTLTGGPIFAIAAVAGGLYYGIRWLSQHMRTRGSVVDQRGELEKGVLPRILGAVRAVSDKLTGIAASLTERFGAIVGALGRLAGQLAGSIVRFLVGAVEWLTSKFKLLLDWAVEKVRAFVNWVKPALERLKAFLEPLFEFVRWIGSVVSDVWNLVSGVVKTIWHKIPACIKHPVIEFFINQILKRIPIFNKLLQINNIWEKVKESAFKVIRGVFVKWDLKQAVLDFFDLVLVILEIPKELLRSIYAKARTAFSEIVKDPIGFLWSVLGALYEGFKLFIGNIGTHLWNGVVNWFRKEMKKAGIEIPTELTFGSIMKLVFSIAGITVEKVFKILERKLNDKPLMDKIRKFYRVLTGVWEWISVAIEKGAAGLWEKLKETAGNLVDALLGGLVGWVGKQVIKLASPRLLAALNPIGAIINAILAAWSAIQTAAEYIRDILGIVDTVLDTALDLARGVTARAAGFVEKALGWATPMAIGFLANFIRLGNLGARVKELLVPVQERVEAAIGALIERALAAGRAILEKLGLAGPAKDEVTFDAGGESHRLFAEGEGDTEEVWLESTRRTAAGWTDYWEKNDLPELPRPEDREQSKADIKSVRSLLTKRRKSKETKLSEVADILKKLFQMFGHPSVKPTVLFFRANTDSKGVRGGFAKAEPLTLKFPEGGDRPSSSTTAPVPGEKRMAQMNRATEKWVKLHMIHFDLGGPDKSQNFAIGDKEANSNMLRRAEEKVINLLTGHAKGALTLWYEIKAEYRTGKNIDFLKTITAEWGTYDVKNDKREKSISKVLSFDSGAPGKRETSVVINDDGPESLEVIGELEWRVATIVRDAARTAPQRLANLKQLEKAVGAVRPSFSQDQVDEVVGAVRTGLNNETLKWEP